MAKDKPGRKLKLGFDDCLASSIYIYKNIIYKRDFDETDIVSLELKFGGVLPVSHNRLKRWLHKKQQPIKKKGEEGNRGSYDSVSQLRRGISIDEIYWSDGEKARSVQFPLPPYCRVIPETSSYMYIIHDANKIRRYGRDRYETKYLP